MRNLEKLNIQELMELRLQLKAKVMDFSIKLTREDERQLGQDIDAVEKALREKM